MTGPTTSRLGSSPAHTSIPGSSPSIRRAAVASLLATSAFFLGAYAWTSHAATPAWMVVSGLATAAALTTRKELAPQVVARALTWVAVGPIACEQIATLLGRHAPSPALLALGLAGTLALVAGTPLLHAKEARATFAPRRFRKTWLAGVTASAASAIIAAAVAAFAARWGELGFAAFAGVMALGWAGAARAVLGMRGLGLLLGAATTAGAVSGALVTGFAPLVLAAVPGLLLVAPVALARVVPDDGETTGTGTGTGTGGDHAPRTRVAALDPPRGGTPERRVRVHDGEDDAPLWEAEDVASPTPRAEPPKARRPV